MVGRSSGILLPVSALPGPYGGGSLGAGARHFVDFLAQAGQHYWQMLPLVPPGGGESPYMSPSSFAGNPLFLDLDLLAEEGLLTQEELESARYPGSPDRVDYPWLHETRPPLLRKAWARGRKIHREELAQFLAEEAGWLPDFALFLALRDRFNGAALEDWPDPVRKREPAVLEELRRELADEVEYHAYLQSLFYRQWAQLRDYAHEKGISIIGDLPIYVSPDSAEVWCNPKLFQLDGDLKPTAQAGVPPDAFSATGQHWGNPLYDWDYHKKTGFAWWKQRCTHMARLYDVLRIDHFRAFHTYWSIPVGAKDAREGHWEEGPGMPLLEALKTIEHLELIAEDLGDLDDAARAFIAESGLPGMKILVYAFDPVGESAYLPHNCPVNAIAYTGTHDTPTFVQWLFDEATPAERAFAMEYLRLRAEEGYGWGAVCGAWISPCALAIAPMQDLLGLGADARMNAPGTLGPQNWSWRVRQAALNPDVAGRLRQITRTYRRT